MAGIARAPLSPGDRIVYLDVLRGVALFGVLAVNVQQFAGTARGNNFPQALVETLIESKFIVLFSFLFGVGFAIQLSRAHASAVRFLSFYPRRLAALALFGLIHGIFIWRGDVLLSYAISGALLLPFRNLSQRAVLIWVGCIICGTLVVASVSFATDSGLQVAGEVVHSTQSHVTAHSSGSLPRFVSENWHAWLSGLDDLLSSIPLLSLFLLGLWVWRSGIVQRLHENQRLLRRICGICLPLGLALEGAAAFMPRHWVSSFTAWFCDVPGLLFPPILSAGYATGLVVLMHNSAWRRRLMPFAAVGRMALTNYLAQSVICTAFFRNTGLYGKLGPVPALICAAVLYAGQVAVSNWWLARFRNGPMEWLWRGMTYGSFHPLRGAPGGEPPIETSTV